MRKIAVLGRLFVVGMLCSALMVASSTVAKADYPCTTQDTCRTCQGGPDCSAMVTESYPSTAQDCLDCDSGQEGGSGQFHITTWTEVRVYCDIDCPESTESGTGWDSNDSAYDCLRASDMAYYGCCANCG